MSGFHVQNQYKMQVRVRQHLLTI